MKSRVFVGLIGLVCVVTHSYGQVIVPEPDRPVVRENVFGLGLAGGAASGVGLSFRHHLPAAFSYQFTGGIIKVDDRLSYAVGAEIQFDLVRGAVWRFFVAGGAGYYHSGTSGHNQMEGPARAGVGIGGESPLGGGFHGTAELMFTYFSDGTVLPLPQVGIHYYFL
jgi:hypothetical protein